MNKRCISTLLIVILTITCVLCGCKKTDKEYKIYYLDINATSLVAVDYKANAKTTEGLIYEIINELSREQSSTKYMKTIPANVSLRDFTLEKGELVLDFSYQYNDLKGLREVLVRAGICKSLLQIDGVDSISIYVSNQPLTDESGNVIGAINKQSFLDYSGNDESDLQATSLTLYYASMDGNYLIKEQRKVSYNKNVSLEKLVLEYLQSKPISKNAQIAIPTNTKVKSVTVSEGICYVTLDASMLSQMNEVSTQTIIYSIVNSLCELDNINKVSIAVENNPVDLIAATLSIDGLYEKNNELIKK